jgi:predicted kinase
MRLCTARVFKITCCINNTFNHPRLFWYTHFMRKAKVYIICGFIGAGKTTFAKKLEKETGAVRITKDEWSIGLIRNDPTIDGYEQWDTKIIEVSRGVAFQLAEKGVDVIMDEGFWAKEERDQLRNKIQSLGAIPVLYYVNTPIAIMRERTLGRNNNFSKDSFHISGEMFDSYLKNWQPPSDDEGYVVVSSTARNIKIHRGILKKYEQV